jgi:hypothetical protein
MYEHTPNLKHTMANKDSMKAFQRFIQTEMNEHDHGELYIFFFFRENTSDMSVCK